MPELPEVETMVRGLRPVMAGRTISRLSVIDAHLLQGCSAEGIERRAGGARVESVGRRGKWVVLELDDRRGLIVIQPRMTGGFRLGSADRPEHVRLRFDLEGTPHPVWFCDTRRLGKIALYDDADLARFAFERSQGPDATEIGLDDLASRLKRTARPIKPALMDQKLLAGIGNIYADESLFRARIHPERPANRLSVSEVARLHAAIRSVLDEAIAAEGSSFDAGYKTVLGLEGGFLAANAMYGRGGKPCPECSEPIVKTRIAGLIGRPTHYCPKCQALRPRSSRHSGD
jgi:formamidopyrimidine-DNA glycosylase